MQKNKIYIQDLINNIDINENTTVYQNKTIDKNILKLIINKLKTTPKIQLNTTTTNNLTNLLPYLSSIDLYINSNKDFSEFLEFDNHTPISETKNIKLTLHVKQNIEINNIKPTDLPLTWNIITY